MKFTKFVSENGDLFVRENKDLRSLREDERQYFDKFFTELEKSKSKGDIEFIYRGSKTKDICEQLLIYDNNIAKLADKLFMVGEKAKYCLTNELGVDINKKDDSDKVFEKIFDMLRKHEWDLDYYIEQEKDFFNFFSSEENKKKFIETIKKYEHKDKLFLRNYYLKLLHQLSCLEYKENSFLVSTTTDSKIAECFSGDDGIVLFCWKVKNIKYEEKCKSILSDIYVPTYKCPPYEHEKEKSEYLGIFPHFIYGFKIIDKNKFVINHHMFDKSNKDIKKVAKFGFWIDQSNFEETLESTNYKHSFSDNDKYFLY